MGLGEDKPFRGSPRSKTTLRVRLFGQSGPAVDGVEGVTVDLSHSGAFLRCDGCFEPGTRLRLEIENADDPDGPPVEVDAEVKWCSSDDEEERGMGVQFLSPPPEVRTHLKRIQSEGELPVFELYDDELDD